MAREARELDARKIKGRKPSFARNVFHVGALGGKRARTPSNDFERTQIPGPGNPSILGQGDLRVAHCESRRETLPRVRVAREARELDARKIKGRKPSFARNVFHVGALGGNRARTPSNDFERTQIPGPGNPSILGQGDLRVAHCESRRETLPGGSGWPEKLESWTPGNLRDESPASPRMCFTLEHSGGKGPVRPATMWRVRKIRPWKPLNSRARRPPRGSL